MKKIYIFFTVFTMAICFSNTSIGQVLLFSDNFDSYTANQQLACQNPTDWTTWHGSPCSAIEDPLISNTFAVSGSNSVVIKQNNDLVRLHGQLTSGICNVSFQIYIPTGKTGYFNSLNKFVVGASDANQRWAFDCYLNSGGTGKLTAAGSNTNFTYTYNTWHPVQLIVDLDLDSAQLWFDGNKIQQWQWTKGYGGAGGYPLQFDATDVFGADTTDEMYIDDFLVTYYPTIICKAAGGNWNTASTWNGDILPSPSDPVKIVTGAVVTLNDNFTRNARTVISGTLNCTTNTLSGSGSFILLTSSTLGIGSSSGITISGNSGNIQVSGLRRYNSSANYIYNGSTAQITGDGLPAVINNLTINNSSGITLTASTSISGTLAMKSGNIITGTNTLTLGTGTGVRGVLSRSSGTIVGNFRRWFSNTTVSNVLFPIGTASNYRPANISFTSAPTTGGTLTASFTASNPGTAGLPLDDAGTQIINAGVDGYWTINAATLTGGTYSLDLTADGFGGISEVSSLRILKRPTGGGNWTLQGSHSVGTGTTLIPVVHRTGLSGFSEFGIGGTINNPLPVELSSFSASVVGNAVKLNWKTETEVNNYGFDIERSLPQPLPKEGAFGTPLPLGKGQGDGLWTKIGFVNGNGNSNSPKSYTFTDTDVLSGKYSYRLKQIDNDGQFEYSKTIEVDLGAPTKFELAQNFPNPFNPETAIRFTLPTACNVRLTIYNLLGQEVKSLVNAFKEAGTHIINFNASDFNSGVYIYKLEANGVTQTRKMTLIK